MWFQFGRSEGFPSQYSANHTPVTVDVTETILIAVFMIILIAYFSIILGYRKRQSIYVTIKIGSSIIIGCLLIVENFGQEWEYGSTRSKTPYRAGIGQEIDAQMTVKIGLRSVNITLKAKPEEGTPLAKETINYNERFPWMWDQGRIGFGPYAGLLQRTFREGQRKGLPIPILWIAEYFVIDGEGIRFGRFYRTAGWYCHILLWTAFACWILTNIFLQSVSRYAAYLTGLIGGLQLLTCFVWVMVHNPIPLVIPFEDGIIKIALGMHFWITFGCGLVCILLAIIMIFLDLRYPNTLSTFLAIDPLGQYDECVMRSCQVDDVLRRKVRMSDSMEMTSLSSQNSNTGMMVLKRRSTIKNAQKSLFRAPIPMKMEIYDDVVIYENQDNPRYVRYKLGLGPLVHRGPVSPRVDKFVCSQFKFFLQLIRKIVMMKIRNVVSLGICTSAYYVYFFQVSPSLKKFLTTLLISSDSSTHVRLFFFIRILLVPSYLRLIFNQKIVIFKLNNFYKKKHFYYY